MSTEDGAACWGTMLRRFRALNPHLEPPRPAVRLCVTWCYPLFDDRMQRMQPPGRMPFYMKSTGEGRRWPWPRACPVPGDMLFPSYRVQGLQIVRDVA